MYMYMYMYAQMSWRYQAANKHVNKINITMYKCILLGD